jgi:hypothetical protein
MSKSCPIAFREIDGTVSRLNALSVTATLVLFLVTHHIAWLYLLGMDFIIRVYGNKSYSPFFNISSMIKKSMHMKTLMVDAGAKRVAAQLGIFFVFLLLVATHFDWMLAADIVTIIFLTCTALEFFFGFCIGCEIYFVVQKFR